MDRTCTWDMNLAYRTVHNKKAIGACMFLSFLGYTGAVALAELKRGTRVRHKIKLQLYFRSPRT